MSKTCGTCLDYSNNSCLSLKSTTSLLDMFYPTTPACEFHRAKVPEQRATQPAPRPQTGLDMLSEETRAKLRLADHRDWHKDLDR